MVLALSKAKLAALRKFLQKKTREAEGRFLIEGWHLLEEALKERVEIELLVYDEEAKREAAADAVLERAIAATGEAFSSTASQLSQITDTKTSQGVVALVKSVGRDFETFFADLPADGTVRLILLDCLGDPGNCGTIVRTSDWFGVDGVIFGVGCAELENGKTARSSMGGLFRVPVAVKVDLEQAIKQLQDKGIQVFTTELDESAVSLAEFQFPERAALVIGNEARGVSVEVSRLADGKLFIPRSGGGESLNAAVAAAVCLAKWRLG